MNPERLAEITPDEVCALIDLAVTKWHEVADKHSMKHCNCFRKEFGQALIERYHFNDDEMIAAQRRRK